MAKNTLLVVDDQKMILSALKRLLRDMDVECFFALTGREALSTIENNEIHVILSDLNMPVMNGIELLKRVKEMQPEIIRLILSGNSESQTVLKAINDGNILRCILKPWDNIELITVLKQALDLYNLRQDKKSLIN
jgi:YesN/AraC family two-component response regulator